jgi:3,4-dihydroxy 2-butanone 4-phosphate synthase/GTP cyclohydrolase II
MREAAMGRGFSSIEEAVQAIAEGRPTILLDAEDRENEGDLVVSAERITPHLIHFMISEGRGQLCVPVDQEIARNARLRLMIESTDLTQPQFAVPIDEKKCSTGISPLDRSMTIRRLAHPECDYRDFLAPGHIFPLIARSNGLADRRGHTEASLELMRLAGLRKAAVLCEICSSDGINMASKDELLEMSYRFELPIITIDALVEAVGVSVPPVATC